MLRATTFACQGYNSIQRAISTNKIHLKASTTFNMSSSLRAYSTYTSPIFFTFKISTTHRSFSHLSNSNTDNDILKYQEINYKLLEIKEKIKIIFKNDTDKNNVEKAFSQIDKFKQYVEKLVDNGNKHEVCFCFDEIKHLINELPHKKKTLKLNLEKKKIELIESKWLKIALIRIRAEIRAIELRRNPLIDALNIKHLLNDGVSIDELVFGIETQPLESQLLVEVNNHKKIALKLANKLNCLYSDRKLELLQKCRYLLPYLTSLHLEEWQSWVKPEQLEKLHDFNMDSIHLNELLDDSADVFQKEELVALLKEDNVKIMREKAATLLGGIYGDYVELFLKKKSKLEKQLMELIGSGNEEAYIKAKKRIDLAWRSSVEKSCDYAVSMNKRIPEFCRHTDPWKTICGTEGNMQIHYFFEVQDALCNVSDISNQRLINIGDDNYTKHKKYLSFYIRLVNDLTTGERELACGDLSSVFIPLGNGWFKQCRQHKENLETYTIKKLIREGVSIANKFLDAQTEEPQDFVDLIDLYVKIQLKKNNDPNNLLIQNGEDLLLKAVKNILETPYVLSAVTKLIEEIVQEQKKIVNQYPDFAKSMLGIEKIGLAYFLYFQTSAI